jgi:hypothetical protein
MHCCLCNGQRGVGCAHIGGPYICGQHPGIKKRPPSNDSLAARIQRGKEKLRCPTTSRAD